MGDPTIRKFGARGEVRLSDGESTIELLFTNRVILEVERATGKAIVKLLSESLNREISMDGVLKMFRISWEAGRRAAHDTRPVTQDMALDWMDKLGFSSITAAVFEGIGEVINFSAEEKSKEGAGEDPAPFGTGMSS